MKSTFQLPSSIAFISFLFDKIAIFHKFWMKWMYGRDMNGWLLLNYDKIMLSSSEVILKFVGNKAKKANLKTGVSRKQSTPNFPKNEHFLPLEHFLRTCAYHGVRNVRFLENLVCFIFLKHPFRDSTFFTVIRA